MSTMTMTKREDYPTCDDFPTLTGKQSPLNLRESPGDHEHGRKNIELARRAGQKVMPWQINEINAFNATNPDGTWTHSDAILIVPRQNGKSYIVALIVLYRIFVLKQNVLFTAQQWTTAKELWEQTWKIVKGRKFLMKLVSSYTCSQGRGTIFLSNGGRVVFTTRSQDAGRGLSRVDLLVFDEAYNLTDSEIAALSFLIQAAEDPQVFYMSSSVHRDFPQHQNGIVLSAMRAQALNEWDPDDPMYFSEYAAPQDLPPDEESTWRVGNPSYGVISNPKKMRNIMRRMNTEEGRINFGVEALGWGLYFEESGADDFVPVLSPSEVAGMSVSDVKRRELSGWRLCVDASPDRDFCSVAVAGRRSDGSVVGLVGYHGPLATADVVGVVMQVCEDIDPAEILVDPKSPAWVVGEALEREGLDVRKLTYPEVKAATGAFLQGQRDSTMWLSDADGTVAAAFNHAETKEDPNGGVRWVRHEGQGTICQLTAVTYAMWAAQNAEEGSAAPVVKKLKQSHGAPAVVRRKAPASMKF